MTPRDRGKSLPRSHDSWIAATTNKRRRLTIARGLVPSPGRWCDGRYDVYNSCTHDYDGWSGIINTRGNSWC